ncbi:MULTISPECIES: DUF1836 domain-containing protein [unclassified Exiguobacterium]|uniref:DUF1836 domain-containing protein n=1 Tax=unclassified Exiguobacterium TaxID=2644629 RepID=UPI000B5917BA|nr:MULTISPECIES: DUF1836 domain-containing protein [unclassified Exiguobacterium]ASI36653.1 hypothetical protein A0126_14030 [Exiguobacterium sp. N4-1P]
MYDAQAVQTLSNCLSHLKEGKGIGTLVSEDESDLPKVIHRLKQFDATKNGLSINEIVHLANALIGEHMSATTIQNWTKREVRDIIGVPHRGKKYSINQAAIIYLLDDLKHLFSLEETRELLTIVFKNPNIDEDDLISPLDFYLVYTQHAETSGPIELTEKRLRRSLERIHAYRPETVHVLQLCLYARRISHLTHEAKQRLQQVLQS